jgi:hypothetical protein
MTANAASSPDGLLLPDGAHLLHIGPQKTGTTTIQLALHRRREELRDLGVLVPGTSTRPRRAVWSLLGPPAGITRPNIKHWERLVDEVADAGDLRVCISTEDWARTDDAGAKATVAGLGGSRPHVIAAARRLDRLLPSQWQQRVKMKAISLTYHEWLERVLGDDTSDPHWRNLWIPHDIGSVAQRWADAAGGSDRFTLVVADEKDHGLLPHTFERMLGLPDGTLVLAEDELRNTSVSLGRIELIRRYNQLAETREWTEPFTTGWVRRKLTDTVKSATPWPDEQKIPPLPDWAAERVRELCRQRAEQVRNLDVQVIGDPDNLLMPEDAPVATAEQFTAPIMVSAELAARAVEEVVERTLETQQAQLDRHRQQVKLLREKLRQSRRRTRTLRQRHKKQSRQSQRDARRAGPRLSEASGRELLGALRGRVVRRLRPGRRG